MVYIAFNFNYAFLSQMIYATIDAWPEFHTAFAEPPYSMELKGHKEKGKMLD